MAQIDFSNATQAPLYDGSTTGDELYYGASSRTTLPVVYKMPYTSSGGSTPQVTFKGPVTIPRNSLNVTDGVVTNFAINSDKVGVGTASPDAVLTVENASTGVHFAVRNTNNTNTSPVESIFTSGNSSLAVNARIRVSGNGVVEAGVFAEHPNSVSILSSGSNGLNLGASDASGGVLFYAGGNTTEVIHVFPNRTVTIGDTHTAPDASYRLKISGATNLVGNLVQTGNQTITGNVSATNLAGNGASVTGIAWANVGSRGNITTTLTGDVTGTVTQAFGANVSVATTLKNSGITAGTYGSGSNIPAITFDSKGIATGATVNPISLANIANSTTSIAITIASKTIFVETGKQFAPGQWVVVSSKANPSNYMSGPVSSYNTVNGQLVFVPRASGTNGSGTFADWTVILVGPNAATSGIQQIAYADRNNVRTTTVEPNIIILTLGLFTYVEGSVKTDDDATVFNAVTGTGKYELVGQTTQGFVSMSGNTTAVANGATYVMTGGILTLPASPVDKDFVEFISLAAQNVCSINPNGKNIMGVSGTMVIDSLRAKGKLVYSSASTQWVSK